MPHYVRARIAGGTYFFTVTSRQRMPVLTADPVRKALRAAIQTTRLRWPFTVDAWVLLPDHLHCV
jgi:putative transposase